MAKKKVSCLPCRLKKVKCDGEYPCQRCQSKDHNCVYQKPKTVGRPPKNAVINKLVLSRIANNNQASATPTKTFCREFIFENVSNSPDLTPIRYLEDSKQHGLQFYANQLFTTIFSKVVSSSRFIQASLITTQNVDFFTVAPKIKVFNMTHFYNILTADIANILARRISRLRLSYYDELAFSKYGLKYDQTSAFFETPTDTALVQNPLNSLPPQQAVRLIECFFGIHPYSILFSKTMLLQSYWTDTADSLLLSVIYGTTVYKSQLLDGKPLVLWEAIEKKNRNPFLDYAYILLSKATAEATPSRYQAVVLLALFEVLFGYPKRGMALFALSHMLAAKLGLYDNTLPGGLNPVEKELLSVTFWASFNCAIRGCIELDRLPKSSLVNHTLPYPPPNVKKSKAYQFDLENGNPRTFKHYGYLVETFYVKSVISRITCTIISYLPDTYISVSALTNCQLKLIGSEQKESKTIKQKIDKVLADFKEFINDNKKSMSVLQLFTLQVYHSFYVLCLSFLRDSSEGIHFPYSIYHNMNTPEQLDLTDLDNVLKVNELVPEAIFLIEKCFNHVSETKNYYNDADFLPKGIMINGLDAAVQILMYSYDLVNSEKVRHYIQLAKIILGLSNVWDDWSTADTIKTAISQFLDEHPVTEESTSSTSTESVPVFEDSNQFLDLLPLLQQPFPADLNNSNMDLMNSPWLTGNEPWMQDINAVLYADQQEQDNQQQQFLNQLELSAMFDNLV